MPSVAHLDDHKRSDHSRAHAHRLVWRRELGGIGQEVVEDLAQSGGVAQDGHRLVADGARFSARLLPGRCHSGPYGTDLAAAFAENFAALGGTVTDNVAYVEGLQSYRDLFGSVYGNDPPAILLVAFPSDGFQIIRDYVLAFEYRQTFWFFTDGVQDQSFVTTVGASNFTFRHEGTAPGTSAGDAFTSFERAHIAKYGFEPAFSTANDYDAVYLLALAVAQAGRADGTAISDNLRRVANPPGMVVGPEQFAQAVAAISAGIKIDYEGAPGPVDLDQNGDASANYGLCKSLGQDRGHSARHHPIAETSVTAREGAAGSHT